MTPPSFSYFVFVNRQTWDVGNGGGFILQLFFDKYTWFFPKFSFEYF